MAVTGSSVRMTMVVVVMAAMAVIMAVVMMMVMMIVRVIRMAVTGMRGDGVGAAFRLERRFDLRNLAAQRNDQGFDAVGAMQPDAVWHDLRRQVAVAKRMRDPGERRNIAAHFQQFFRSCDDLDGFAGVEQQDIVRL